MFVRGRDGVVRALINSCTHRGARVCRQDAGNAKSFQCFYHAWTFSTEGELVGMPDKEGYAPAVDPAQLGLRHVPRLESYRDFWFVSFDADAEPLADYLAGAKEYIDLVADQGIEGMRVLPGSHQYACNANWKLMVENCDRRLPRRAAAPHVLRVPGQPGRRRRRQEPARSSEARAYDLGNGHAVVDYPAPFPRVIARWHPIFGEDAKPEIQAIRDELVERHGEERAYRMAETCRNLFVFPNLLLLDVAGLTIRTVNPVRPDYMELTAHALAAREEGPERLRRRLENFNLFLGPGGLATPDDVEALEACQEGFQATAERLQRHLARHAPRRGHGRRAADARVLARVAVADARRRPRRARRGPQAGAGGVMTRADVEDFLYREAELLDDWRLDDWLELYAGDCRYVVPATDLPDGDPRVTLGLIDDDRTRLKGRVDRLKSAKAYREFPWSRVTRLISNVRVLDDGHVASAFAAYRYRKGDEQVLVGRYEHQLVEEDGDV